MEHIRPPERLTHEMVAPMLHNAKTAGIIRSYRAQISAGGTRRWVLILPDDVTVYLPPQALWAFCYGVSLAMVTKLVREPEAV